VTMVPNYTRELKAAHLASDLASFHSLSEYRGRVPDGRCFKVSDSASVHAEYTLRSLGQATRSNTFYVQVVSSPDWRARQGEVMEVGHPQPLKLVVVATPFDLEARKTVLTGVLSGKDYRGYGGWYPKWTSIHLAGCENFPESEGCGVAGCNHRSHGQRLTPKHVFYQNWENFDRASRCTCCRARRNWRGPTVLYGIEREVWI